MNYSTLDGLPGNRFHDIRQDENGVLWFGTDQGVAPHGDNALEFVFMVEAGMKPLDAIRSAPFVLAEAMHAAIVAEAFGTPVHYPLVKGIAGYPYIIEVLKQEHEVTNFGGIWHSDTSYLEVPPAAT